MRRRDFLRTGASALVLGVGAASCRRDRSVGLRILTREGASDVEATAAADAASLLSRATGREVPVLGSRDATGASGADIAITVSSGAPGAFRLRSAADAIVVDGADAEGARNGLYALLEEWGFAFFRDGETVPDLADGVGPLAAEVNEEPAFRWRGDMIWDNYLGPRRFCASMWGEPEWERALVYMARNRMNFLELYPPLEAVYARAFPELAASFEDGVVWKGATKHALAKRVLARGRALGIRFMYVLSYGSFPEPVREHYSHLEWRNGFLCAHQPELMELSGRLWRALLEELGTDHWYAIRHRGEEEQVYSDPCRSVTKAEGFQQAFEVMAGVDPDAAMTAWTWGERIPDLFERFPDHVLAAHIRHGMADVFGDRGEGREQADGRPALPPPTRWLSGQFTVFGGNETGLQTGWCDAAALQRDAVASRESGAEGYFQWPEWSDTSPWLADVIARLGWRPEGFELEGELARYAARRHGDGDYAEVFLEAFRPLVMDGNAKFMHPPRKRLLVPFFNAGESLSLLEAVRQGARAMYETRDEAPPAFRRDFLDIVTWTALRQAQVLECEAYFRRRAGEEASLDGARATWTNLAALLGERSDLSIVASARELASVGPLSPRLDDSLWTLACDFYNGYPLVLSPEAIELVYLPQLDGLQERLASSGPIGLEEPGWFWHDFPDRAWAELVRKLPSEDPELFEERFRERLRGAATEAPAGQGADVEALLSLSLPPPRDLDAWSGLGPPAEE